MLRKGVAMKTIGVRTLVAGFWVFGSALTPTLAWASARSLDAAGTSIIAFSDLHQSPFSGVVQGELSGLRSSYCAGKGDHGRKLSLAAGLRIARQLVSADSHGRGLGAFAHSRDGHSEKRALPAAAGALGAGQPAAALAALLRAHRLAPRDPVPLIDAAPLLSDAGKGRAALALLAAAGRLGSPKTHPFGIGWKAMAANNRGQALLVTHQYRAAEKALNAAVDSAPLLREAEQNLTVAYECAGKTSQATRMLFLAVRRQRFAAKDFVEKSAENPSGQLDQAPGLDTSRGTKLTLPTFKYPRTTTEGRRQHDAYQRIQNDLVQNQIPAMQKQGTSDSIRLYKELEKGPPITLRRTEDILASQGDAAWVPRLAKLNRRASELQGDMTALSARAYGQGGCLNHGLHGQWLSDMKAYDTAMRKYAAGEYKYETAIAANLKNPLAHHVALENAQTSALFNLEFIDSAALGLTDYDQICGPGNASGTENPESGDLQTPASAACPSGIRGPGLTINLLVWAFSVDCEQVKFRLTIGEGWLNGFVSISHNFRTGSSTIFAGPQVGVQLDTGPFQGGATARGGAYLTVGSDGSIQDIGLRAESSAGLKVSDTAGASISGPSLSIGIAGAFAPAQ